MIGMLLTIILSPKISQLTISSNANIWSIIFLSLIVLLNGISYVNLAIIQGTQKLKTLAIANIYAALAGFAISVPLYYFFGTKSIVLSLVLAAFSLFLITEYYFRKNNFVDKYQKQSFIDTWNLGIQPVKLGIMISISFIAVSLAEFLIKTFIGRHGGIDLVGFYQAGWTLNTTYLGMVFTAMSTDFFPRLSLSATDDSVVKIKVNQQAEISLLILGPLISIMIVALPLIIKLLFTNDFLVIVTMTRLMLFGSLLKAGSWAISFIFLAKGHGKLYLFNELSVKLVTIPIYLLLYYYYGLEGIGIAFVFDQLFYLTWVSFAAWLKYKFLYSFEFYKLLLIIGGFSILPFVLLQCGSNDKLQIIISILSIIFVICFSLFNLNKKIDFVDMVKMKLVTKKN